MLTMKWKEVLCVVIFFTNFDCIPGSATYQSIIWDPDNPLFIANCPSGSKHRVVNVEAQAKLHFVCPNVATLMKNTFTEVSKIRKYENLWIVHNKRSFDECDSSLDPKSEILMRCKDPTSLQFRTVIFQRHSAENNLQFEKGKSYYFIATSNGMLSTMNDTRGGHCNGTENNGYLKIEIHVCGDADSDCSSNVGEPHCPVGPVVSSSPSSSIATLTPSPSRLDNTICSTPSVTHIATKIVPTTVSCNPEASCTATVTETTKVSCTPSVEGSATAGKRKSDLGSENETESCVTWKVVALIFIVICIVLILGFAIFHFGCGKGNRMKCPYETNTKVEQSKENYGVENSGFQNGDTLKRSLTEVEPNNDKNVTSLVIKNQDVHFYNAPEDVKKTLPV